MPPQAMAKPLKGTLQHNLAPKNLVEGVGSFHLDPRVLEGRHHLFGRLGQDGTVLPELGFIRATGFRSGWVWCG